MNRILRSLLNLDLVDLLTDTTSRQAAFIAHQQLEYARGTRDLISGFIQAMDSGIDPDELRGNLQAGLSDLSDEVARLEEHAS